MSQDVADVEEVAVAIAANQTAPGLPTCQHQTQSGDNPAEDPARLYDDNGIGKSETSILEEECRRGEGRVYNRDNDAYNQEGPLESDQYSNKERYGSHSTRNSNEEGHMPVEVDYDNNYAYRHQDPHDYRESVTQDKFNGGFSDKRTYKKISSPKEITDLEKSYSYHIIDNETTTNETNDSSTSGNESNIHSNPQSRRFVQLENALVEDVESCQRDYKYGEFSNSGYQRENCDIDRCVIREYVVYQGNQPDPRSDRYQGSQPDSRSDRYQGSQPDPRSDRYQGSQPDPGSDRYQGSQPDPRSDRYQGSQPDPRSDRYQGSQPDPRSDRYQGSQPDRRSDGYQGSQPDLRPDSCYQGSQPDPRSDSYQGSQPDPRSDSNFSVDRHKYYDNYELQNEKYFSGDAAPVVHKSTQELNYMYEPDEDNLYNRDATATQGEDDVSTSYDYPQNETNPGETCTADVKMYEGMQFTGEEVFQEKSNLHVGRENEPLLEGNGPDQRAETLAVDLRVLRPLSYTSSSGDFPSSYDTPQVSNRIYFIDKAKEKASSAQTSYEQNSYYSSETTCVVAAHTCPTEGYRSYTHQPGNQESFGSVYVNADVVNHGSWDVATNTDHAQVVDKETQVMAVEVKEIAIQTDTNHIFLPFALLRNADEIAKYTCPICYRVYISKSSFDRHFRTHDKEKNNLIDHVKIKKESKLQICKRVGKNKLLRSEPVIIQVPRSVYKCDMCEKSFPSQSEKDTHDCANPFPSIKCPECHITFYTPGGLNEHMGILHKAENSYYCIFCNNSFNTAYTFHLHLEEHLST